MKQLLICSFLMIYILGCTSNFDDVSDKVKSFNIALPENKHIYSATWLSDSKIVFIKGLEREDFEHDYFINPSSIIVMDEFYSYDVDNQNWSKFSLGDKLNCHIQSIGLLERLPNGKLGYVQSCWENKHGIIREFDMNTNGITELFRNGAFPNWDVGVIGTYAFSPDMSEWIQEDATGQLLDNQLYYLKQNEEPIQIISNFIRAMSPAWSPYQREIAFWGTKDYSDGNPNDFKTLPQILGLAGNPWDLYFSTPEGDNPHIVLSSVEDPGSIKWSPVKNIIAFSGKYKGVEGIWLFGPQTSKLTRIWNKRVGFDWSPDGTKMVISYADYSDYPNVKDMSVNIIQVP